MIVLHPNMAPSAESRKAAEYNDVAVNPEMHRTVTSAVNYEPSMVDQFASCLRGSPSVKFVPSSTVSSARGSTPQSQSPMPAAQSNPSTSTSCNIGETKNMENSAPNKVDEGQKPGKESGSLSGKRRSKREQKRREITLVSNRVRYDMEMVPYVGRHKVFLEAFPFPGKNYVARSHPKEPGSFPLSETLADCSVVLWSPVKRSEWEDSVSEMTAVCTSAALRKSNGKKPFVPPLSRAYIRDRVDIDDDPLRGFQIRHAKGGWLQGFVTWTKFTTWTYFFKWDSLHEKSGVPTVGADANRFDIDGSLAQRLDSQPRSGDPLHKGIVFENIAEIGLLGALGCGELLLRLVLEDIVRAKSYSFVVLQATDGSKAFYEKFGFRRVGAVCRYGEKVKQGIAIPTLDSPVQGYRHWTHATESQKSLDLHGGPSYMMCLELEKAPILPSLLDKLQCIRVEDKPLIQQLGAAPSITPRKRLKKQDSTISSCSTPSLRESTPKPDIVRPEAPPCTPKSLQHLRKRPRLASSTPGKPGEAVASTIVNSVQNTPSSRLPPDSNSRMSSKLAAAEKIGKDENEKVDVVGLKKAANGSRIIDKKTFVKQKVKSYPRDRPHFYNKVVKPKRTEGHPSYYFVLNFNEKEGTMRVVPMVAKGVLSGKREGRPRFQCVVEETDSNFKTVHGDDYEAVPAVMVMKTPLIAQEAWDIL